MEVRVKAKVKAKAKVNAEAKAEANAEVKAKASKAKFESQTRHTTGNRFSSMTGEWPQNVPNQILKHNLKPAVMTVMPA